MHCVKTLKTSVTVPQRQEAKPPKTDSVSNTVTRGEKRQSGAHRVQICNQCPKRRSNYQILANNDDLHSTNLSESIADPSSYSSSTISGSRYSLSIWEEDSEDFLRNMDLNTPLPSFFGCGKEAAGFSGGTISITMQVVSSRSPFTCTASCKWNAESKTKYRLSWMVSHDVTLEGSHRIINRRQFQVVFPQKKKK